MSDNKQIQNIKDIMINKMPTDLVNNVLQFRGRYNVLPMCIEIEAVNRDWCEHDIYDIYFFVISIDDSHYHIIDYVRDKNIIISKNEFEAYMYDVYIDLIDRLENDEYVNDCTITANVYFHKGQLPRYFGLVNDDCKQNLSSECFELDLDDEEENQTKTAAKFINHILHKMNLSSTVKELVPY